MKKLSLSLMTALAMSFNFGNAQEMKVVTIAGKVINVTDKTPQVIKFNFCNPLISGSQSAKLNEKNEFTARQDMMYTQNMTVNYLNYFINLYVQPGDSVHLTIDASLLDKSEFSWVVIDGDHASISRQLNLCVNYIYKLPVHSNNPDLPPDAMMSALKQDYQYYLQALHTFVIEKNLDPIVEEWAKKDIKFLISNPIPTKYGRKGSSDRLKVYSDPFFDVFNSDNFQSMMFQYHLGDYVYSLIQTDSTIHTDIKENRPVAALRKGMSMILKEPAGECRDYMLYQYLSSPARYYPGILDSLKSVNTLFTKTVYYNSLKNLAATITKPNFPVTDIKGISYLRENGSILAVPETDVFSYLKSKYPGKVLYIDVYTTWCGPCLQEMDSAPALHQAMQGKNVVFVNLCLQSTEANWKKLVKDRKLQGENYFFADDATKLFIGTYRLLGYPSYIMVDKKGQITTTAAPRPSEKNAANEAILKLTNE